jgi:hypothetical protein
MKTLKKINNNETSYLRVADHEVNRYIREGYQFCQKTEWKENVRDFEKRRKEEAKKSKKPE